MVLAEARGGAQAVATGEALAGALCHALEVAASCKLHKQRQQVEHEQQQQQHLVSAGKPDLLDVAGLAWGASANMGGRKDDVRGGHAMQCKMQGKNKCRLSRERTHTIHAAAGRTEVIPAQLLLVSIGYRSLALPGVPFDDGRAVVPNTSGRVPMELVEAAAAACPEESSSSGPAGAIAPHPQQQHEHHHPHQQQQQQSLESSPGSTNSLSGGRLYVVGWLKRGPSGIIGTNAVDADETVSCIVEVGICVLANMKGVLRKVGCTHAVDADEEVGCPVEVRICAGEHGALMHRCNAEGCAA
eukprot:1158140-Pelagomonas_calceolata.AAC.11